MNLLMKARIAHREISELEKSMSKLTGKLGIIITFHSTWNEAVFSVWFKEDNPIDTRISLKLDKITEIHGYSDDDVNKLYSRFRQVMFGVSNNEP